MRKALTIRQNDARFAGFPDFEELRRLGVEYIAQLSGDLWTDHNTHDPGITILEVLCYALTDLGYRTSLEVPELLAPTPGTESESNFFTPEEILTNNPLTILDYRKMLVDIAGVRNAWIEPAGEQEVPLFHDCAPDSLRTTDPQASVPIIQCISNKEPEPFPHNEVKLNGLYRVFLDLETTAAIDALPCADDEADLSAILAEVHRRLHRHRNLCEDFLSVEVLRDEEIGLCADLELEPTAQPDEVLGLIYEALENFITPRLQFYSLAEMLERGHPIEQIYRGRPYTPSYITQQAAAGKFSHGFVEEEQLRGTERATEFFASDYYRVIMNVEGVRAIRSLSLSSYRGDQIQIEGEEWRLPLTAGHRPVFAPDRSSFKFYKGVIRLQAGDPAGVLARFRKRLADYQKTKYQRSKLDSAVPYGRHRKDLGSYYSVQHEFPTVYGIGPGDLSGDASPARKAQALQLQGYLSFFDQLLADYLAQLAHVRQLFALRSDSNDDGRTYYSQVVDNAPQIAKLARFFRPESTTGSVERLVRSGRVYDHPAARDQAIEGAIAQLRITSLRDFRDQLDVRASDSGYRFVFLDTRGEVWLEGIRHFQVAENARADGESVLQRLLFQGIIADNYERENRPANRCYRFYIKDDPASYGDFLQEIVESPELFYRRRDQFLNHLLARFGEQFTDYVLLMFALNQGSADPATIIRDKERFLANYPTISRNRGRGFDYTDTEELWDSSANLSGLETRVSHLMGIDDWRRRNLNPFSVQLRDQAVYLELRDHRHRTLLRTAVAYQSDAAACSAAEELLELLTQPDSFSPVDCPAESTYGYQLLDANGKPLAYGMRTFPDPDSRASHLVCLKDYFTEPLGLTAVVTESTKGFGFQIQATNRVTDSETPDCLFINEQVYDSFAKAEKAALATLDYLHGSSVQLFNSPNSPAKGYGIKISTTGKLSDPDAIVSRYPEIFNSNVGRKAARDQIKGYLNGLLPNSMGIMARLSSQGGGYFFQALDANETSVYLQTDEAATTYAEACRDGLELIDAARITDHYVETAGSFGEGRFSFKVATDEREFGLHPRGYDKVLDRDLALGEVAQFMSERQLDYQIRQDPPRFTWRVVAGDPEFELCGLHAFKDEETARAAWEEVRSDAENKTQYRLEVDESGGWFWMLRRGDGLVLAHSASFPDQDSARAARKSFLTCLSEEDPTLSIDREDGGFYFVLLFDSAEALIGLDRYPSQEEAACAFLHFTPLAAEAANYRERPFGDDCLSSFDVWEDEYKRAYHPRYYPTEEMAAYQKSLIEHIATNRHPFLIKELAGAWQFTIYWENCTGTCAPLFRQTLPEESSQIAAKESLRRFIDNLGPWEDLESEEGFSWLAEVSGDQGQAIVAEHPFWYDTEAERDRVKEDARAYLDRYRRLVDGDERLLIAVDAFKICGTKPQPATATEPVDCPHIQPYTPSGADCILSGFSLRKDDRPVATHPTSYLTADERNAVRDRLLRNARCKRYQYKQLQLIGERVVVRIGLRYYYEWWEVGDTPRRLWRSVASYESEAAARAAFETERLDWLALADRTENYGMTSLTATLDELARVCDTDTAQRLDSWHAETLPEEERLVLYQEDVPVLFLPDAPPAPGDKTERIAFARAYPILKEAQNIYFRLLDPDSEQTDWRSTNSFETEAEGWTAFRHFLRLLPNAENYLPNDKPEPCIFTLNLVETLLVSERTYADHVVLQAVAENPTEFTSLEAAETALAQLRDMEFSQLQRTVEKNPQDARQRFYQLSDPDQGRVYWRSTASFFDPVALEEDWDLFRRNLTAGNYAIQTLGAEKFKIQLSRIAFTQLALHEEEETGKYYIEQAEYKQPEYQIGDDLRLPVAPLTATPPAGTPICPKAWNNGLEDFLIYGTQAAHYYPFFDPSTDCSYRFRVVTDQYRLARNPRESHTPAERECLLDWLYHHANCQAPLPCDDPNELPLTDIYQITIFGRDGRCHYRLTPTGSNIDHWDSYEGYDDENAARAAFYDHQTKLMGYAQEPDCYELIRAESPDEEPRWHLGLIDEEGRRVWVTRHCFRASEFNAAVLERVMHARTYPFFYYRGSYGFQTFALEDLPDCRNPEASPCLPQKPESETLPMPVAGNQVEIAVEVPGEVIWESIQDYSTPDEAICAYKHFRCLLTDLRNYQRTRLSDCNLFGLELTHPNEVLATHPQGYATYEAALEAMEMTRACINAEGLHLVEHILLRPKMPEQALIRDNCPDCCHAEFLPPETTTQAACAPPDKLAAQQTDPDSELPAGTEVYVPGADPYSFWATVVLPYWPERFQNINFRNFFEDTLRREAPAHVALRICWLDPKQMQWFEYHYRQWLTAQAGEGDCLIDDALRALIDSLARLTTVYPPAELQEGECSGNGSQAGAVLLDSTQLS